MKRKTNPRRSKARGIGPLLRIILQRGAGKCYFVDYSKKLPNGTFTTSGYLCESDLTHHSHFEVIGA